MRIVKYTTYWSYGGKGVKREAPLWEFILDIPYVMENTGAIPPLKLLNEVLKTGGTTGGMSPGTKWRPFQIDTEEYEELKRALFAMDIQAASQQHPYVQFSAVKIDEELNQLNDFHDWLRETFTRYHKSKDAS